MIRNSRKIWPIGAPVGGTPRSIPSGRASFVPVSLMALGCVPLEAVHHARLRCAQRNPILHILLKRNEELFAALSRLLVDIFARIEFHLKREFPDKGLVFTASAPQGDVALSYLSLAKVEFSQFKQDFLDDCFAYKRYSFIGLPFQDFQCGKDAYQRLHRRAVRFVHLAQAVDAIVGIKNSVRTNLILLR